MLTYIIASSQTGTEEAFEVRKVEVLEIVTRKVL